MLVKEIIQRVQSLYSKGVDSDDSRLSDRHIYSKLISSRSTLIKQQANKRQKISQWNYQVLPCVELVKAPVHECPCLPPLGCTILKSKYPLPNPIVNLNEHLIQSVTSLDGSIIFSEVSWTEKKYRKYNKYTSNKPDYFIRNGHLYITAKTGLEIVTVTGLFEDPVEANVFQSYCPNSIDECISAYDTIFPIDLDKVETLVKMAVNELISVFAQMIEDQTNNTKDSPEERSK